MGVNMEKGPTELSLGPIDYKQVNTILPTRPTGKMKALFASASIKQIKYNTEDSCNGDVMMRKANKWFLYTL